MTSHPTHLKGTTSAPPSLTSTTNISTLSITPTIPSYGPPPPPPQPPPAPNIPSSFKVSDTNFASSTALQQKGRDRTFRSCLKFVVEGAENNMNEILDSSFSSQSSVDSMMSMSVDDDEFPPRRKDASPLLLLTSEPNPHSRSRSNYVGALKTSTLSYKDEFKDPVVWFTLAIVTDVEPEDLVCVCVILTSVEGGCPLRWYQPQGKFTPPPMPAMSYSLSDTPSASPWEDVS
jgi:hypothetical protein